MRKTIFFVGLTLLVVSCGVHRSPASLNEDGSYTLLYQHPYKSRSEQQARKLAAKHCESSNQTYMIVDLQTEYSGSLSEESTATIRAIGRMGSVMGVEDAEEGAHAATQDSNYTTTIRFRCK
ncbi:MAG: hypothetical protein R3A11_07275 [Bdellovibrionota bacterium]